MIPFNKPFLAGNELLYIKDAVLSGKISGNGKYTKKCHAFFESVFQFNQALMTTSCTDALEMSAILCNIEPNDEVILPSYTFVSTANAFALRGAKLVFADSCDDHPNISVEHIEELITTKTKAIVVVHYAGVACDMGAIKELIKGKGIHLIEDAAQAVDSYYKNNRLGSLGDFGCFSFHETKNINAGEGGLLVINNSTFCERAEYIWEKGTNRSAFFRGEVNKYDWIDIGSSFLPSDMLSAFLFAQLENLDVIQKRRIEIWNYYYELLDDLAARNVIELPYIPQYATNNGHMFYLITKNFEERNSLLKHLHDNNIWAVFHYLGLHNSPFHLKNHQPTCLPNTEKYASTLIRLPLFYDLENKQIEDICNHIHSFYKK